MTCQEAENWFALYLFEELAQVEQAQFQAHTEVALHAGNAWTRCGRRWPLVGQGLTAGEMPCGWMPNV